MKSRPVRLAALAQGRLFAIALCVVLMSASPMLAQSAGKGGPLSGTWTGELTAGERNVDSSALKFAADEVTARSRECRIRRRQVRDLDPKTGALKLDLEIEGDSAVR